MGATNTSSSAPKSVPKQHRTMPKPLRKLLKSSKMTRLPYLPTSIHLRAELALLACNILLICASSHNLYRNAYLINWGDWKYLLVTSMWLGRHVFLRIVCTSSWVDVGDGIGKRHVVDGLGGARRKDFDVWKEQQTSLRRSRSFAQIVYGWFKWIMRALSPWNVIGKMVYFIKEYGMGGQYCDGGAARGVASAAMMSGTGNSFSGGEDHHTSSKMNKHGHHGSQHPVQTEKHIIGILFLARVWGALCALSSALWALVQSGDAGGETMGHIGGTIMGWIKSCLAILKPGQSNSEQPTTTSQSGNKKSRKKHHHQTGGANSATDPDSLDFVNGKLQMFFQIFPDHIRSRALHTQQMRTSEMFITLQKMWESFPPAQMQIAILTFLILISGWLFYVDDGYYYRLFIRASDDDQLNHDALEPNFGFNKNGLFDEQNPAGPLSAYWYGLTQPHVPDIFNTNPPSFLNLMFRVVSFGTAASLLMYGRVLLPIPEYVAGTNVLKAVRAEARSFGGVSARNIIKQNKDLPWVERYKSITTENRLRLYCKVGMIRIIENVLLCAILPHTEVVCRITGHCEPGPLIWGVSGVTGISGSRYTRGSFDALMSDPFTTRASILVVTFLSVFLLLAQMTVMDRTYLAIMGYICGEWRLVREDSGSEKISFFGKQSTAPPVRRTSNSTIMQWDPKRRYSKGDLITFDRSIYEATSNSPEGPPFDMYMRAAHDIYSEELGHRSTSALLSNISMTCWIMASIMCGAMFFWKSAGWNFIPLMFMSVACAIAGSVTAHLCDSCSSFIIDTIIEIEERQ